MHDEQEVFGGDLQGPLLAAQAEHISFLPPSQNRDRPVASFGLGHEKDREARAFEPLRLVPQLAHDTSAEKLEPTQT